MASSIYLATTEPNCGKSLVLLGILELLSHRVERLGIFRPVIRDHGSRDSNIELARTHFGLAHAYDAAFATTYQQASQIVSDGRQAALLERILTRFKELRHECDFVVCEGTDFTGVASAFEFEFNARVANHLSCPVLIVANGAERTPTQLLENANTARRAFLAEGCTILATIVNRATESVLEAREELLEAWPYDDPLWLIAEQPAIASPTIAEIASELDAEIIYGDDESLNRDALHYKIAAMELPHFLEHVVAGSLIIAPGDRGDIVLGCLATTLSESYAKIAGILLTGGLSMAPQIRRLIDGIQRPPLPILSVTCDTFTAATRILGVRAAIAPHNQRKIAAALGAFEASVDVGQLAEQIKVSRPLSVTPLMFEHDLVERAKASRRRIVLPEGAEDRILQAAEILLRREVVDITLLGDRQQINSRMGGLGIDLEPAEIVDPLTSEWREDFIQTYLELRAHKGVNAEMAADAMLDVSYFGTMMVYKGFADGMVSGSVHTTAQTIRPALEIIKTAAARSIVSSVMFMCLRDRVLVYGDCAINPNPDARQLADIAMGSAETARMFGIEPRVAMLSYSTGKSGEGADVEQVREATAIAREMCPELKIDGPIQYDAAIDAGVARTKLPESKVAGRATVFIFPDLNTGNNTYKAVQRSAQAVAIGPVLQGLRKPVNDLSRGCTVTDIVNTVAITAVQAHAFQRGRSE